MLNFASVFRFYHNSSNKRKIKYLRKKGCKIGQNVSILCNVSSFSTEPYLIKIGNDVRITAGVRLLTHDGASIVVSRIYNQPFDKFGRIEIGNNVFIGIDSIILPNVKIGSNVIIGAGSIVTKDILDNTVVAGVPAKFVCSIEDYYLKNKESFYLTRGLKPSKKKEIILEKIGKENEL